MFNHVTFNYQKAIQIISERTCINEYVISQIISETMPMSLLKRISTEDELFAYILIFEEELKYSQGRYLTH